MKETISVNLASQAFTFDKDAYRSSDDVVIAGVCAGVADYLGLPSGKVRLATLLLVLVGGLSIWVYILLWIVVPKGPKRLEGNSR